MYFIINDGDISRYVCSRKQINYFRYTKIADQEFTIFSFKYFSINFFKNYFLIITVNFFYSFFYYTKYVLDTLKNETHHNTNLLKYLFL